MRGTEGVRTRPDCGTFMVGILGRRIFVIAEPPPETFVTWLLELGGSLILGEDAELGTESLGGRLDPPVEIARLPPWMA